MIEWAPFLSYVLVTTFTPGPNNLISMTIGLQSGYKVAFKFITGVLLGFFTIVLVCSLFVETILYYLPSAQFPLKIFGAIYIEWLAVKILISSINKKSNKNNTKLKKVSLGIKEGFIMQFANPKGIIFGITVTSTFIVPYVSSVFILVIFSIFLGFIAFISTSSWAFLGSIFHKYLEDKTFNLAFNIIMALLLTYSAMSIIEII